MHIKRFTGTSVKEAMKAIRAEFSNDALILSRKKASGGLYEVVVAIDYGLSRGSSLNSDNDVSSGFNPPERRLEASCTLRGKERPKSLLTDTAMVRRMEIKEINEFKELCMRFVSSGNTPASRLFLRFEKEFLNSGLDKRLARKILATALKGTPADRASDEDFMRVCIRNRVLENIRVSDPLDKKGTVAFAGPAGAGKTTTIAKLAADQVLRKKKRVALLTMDTYRVAAAEQLRTYGKILGVPVVVAKDPAELAYSIRFHGDKDLILVDTAGRSQRNSVHMWDLKKIADIGHGIRFNLVLSANSKDETLYDSIRGFCGTIPVDSLTFTKLDETLVHGSIINSMLLAKKPVAYLSDGQRVPEDIAQATKERLLKLFMPGQGE